MNPTDATQLTVPLTSAIVACGGIVSALIGVVLWAYSTFEKKDESKEKHDSTDTRMADIEKTVNKTATDVAFIRGLLEGKRNASRLKPKNG